MEGLGVVVGPSDECFDGGTELVFTGKAGAAERLACEKSELKLDLRFGTLSQFPDQRQIDSVGVRAKK